MDAANAYDLDVEVVEAGDRERWPARWLAVALVLIVAAGGLVAWWEDRDAQRRLDGLRACVTRGDTEVADAERRTASISNYVLPSLTADMSRATRNSIFQIIAQTATRTLPGLTAARDACRQVPVRPWAGAQRSARDAYVAYVDAVLVAQQAVAQRGQAIYATRDTAARQRQLADRALRRASVT